MASYLVYLVRHGVAAEQGPEFPNDDDRPLTSEGIRKMNEAARGMQRLGLSFDLILSSPLRRAG